MRVSDIYLCFEYILAACVCVQVHARGLGSMLRDYVSQLYISSCMRIQSVPDIYLFLENMLPWLTVAVKISWLLDPNTTPLSPDSSKWIKIEIKLH